MIEYFKSISICKLPVIRSEHVYRLDVKLKIPNSNVNKDVLLRECLSKAMYPSPIDLIDISMNTDGTDILDTHLVESIYFIITNDRFRILLSHDHVIKVFKSINDILDNIISTNGVSNYTDSKYIYRNFRHMISRCSNYDFSRILSTFVCMPIFTNTNVTNLNTYLDVINNIMFLIPFHIDICFRAINDANEQEPLRKLIQKMFDNFFNDENNNDPKYLLFPINLYAMRTTTYLDKHNYNHNETKIDGDIIISKSFNSVEDTNTVCIVNDHILYPTFYDHDTIVTDTVFFHAINRMGAHFRSEQINWDPYPQVHDESEPESMHNGIIERTIVEILFKFMDICVRHFPGLPYGAHDLKYYNVHYRHGNSRSTTTQRMPYYFIDNTHVANPDTQIDVGVSLCEYSYIPSEYLQYARVHFIKSLVAHFGDETLTMNTLNANHNNNIIDYLFAVRGDRISTIIPNVHGGESLISKNKRYHLKTPPKIPGVLNFYNPGNSCTINSALSIVLSIFRNYWHMIGKLYKFALPPEYDHLFTYAYETGLNGPYDIHQFVKSFNENHGLDTITEQCDVYDVIEKIVSRVRKHYETIPNTDFYIHNVIERTNYTNIMLHTDINNTTGMANVHSFQTQLTHTLNQNNVKEHELFLIQNNQLNQGDWPLFYYEYIINNVKYELDLIIMSSQNTTDRSRRHFSVFKSIQDGTSNVIWIDDNQTKLCFDGNDYIRDTFSHSYRRNVNIQDNDYSWICALLRKTNDHAMM